MVKSSIFRDVMPCCLIKVNWCFEGTYRLQLQGWRVSQVRSIGWLLLDYMALDLKRQNCSQSLLWETKIQLADSLLDIHKTRDHIFYMQAVHDLPLKVRWTQVYDKYIFCTNFPRGTQYARSLYTPLTILDRTPLQKIKIIIHEAEECLSFLIIKSDNLTRKS
jgi:hypothetical protein